jgi:hypothetical protein
MNGAAMESSEVLRQAMSERGAKAVAAELGVSLSLVYKWCEPRGDGPRDEQSGTRNPLDRVVELARVTGAPSLVPWICEKTGGFFVSNPPSANAASVEEGVVKNTQKMLSEFSDVLDRVCRAIADSDGIDSSEAEGIRAEWEQLKSCGESFVMACEKGIFLA